VLHHVQLVLLDLINQVLVNHLVHLVLLVHLHLLVVQQQHQTAILDIHQVHLLHIVVNVQQTIGNLLLVLEVVMHVQEVKHVQLDQHQIYVVKS